MLISRELLRLGIQGIDFAVWALLWRGSISGVAREKIYRQPSHAVGVSGQRLIAPKSEAPGLAKLPAKFRRDPGAVIYTHPVPQPARHVGRGIRRRGLRVNRDAAAALLEEPSSGKP